MAALTAAETRRAGAAAREGARAPLRRAGHGHGRRQQRRHPRQGRHPRTTSPRSPAPTTESSTSAPSIRPPPAASPWCSGWRRYGVKFEKDEHGEYAVRRVHRSGSLRAADARGQGRQEGALPGAAAAQDAREDPDREPPDAGAGAHRRAAARSARSASNTRTGEFVAVARQGGHPRHRRRAGGSDCPPSGYLYGTYENPTNAGDGYSMAYHAGAELSRHRVLPDQPADQGLQRPGLRLRRQPVRRLPGQRARASGSSTPTTGRAR